MLVGRLLGPEGLGQFAFVLAYISLFTFLSDLGLHLFLIREVSRDLEKVRFYLSHAFVLVLFLSPVTCALVIAISYLLELEAVIRHSIYLGTGWIVAGAYLSLFRAAFHAYEKMEYETMVVLTERIVALVGAVVVLLLGWGVIGLIGLHFAARLISLAVAVIVFIARIDFFPTPAFSLANSIQMLKNSLPFAVNILTTTVYIQVDLVLLGIWSGDEASGYYRAATSLIIPLAVFAASLNFALFPNMARSFLTSIDQTKRMLEASTRYLFMLGWPIGLGMTLLAPAIITLVYGHSFQPSIIALRVLALVVPMRYVNNALGTGLTAVNLQGIRSLIILAGAGTNLLLNIMLIPRYSYLGASYATLVTELLILALLAWSVNVRVGKLNLTYTFGKIIVAGIMMAGVTYVLRDSYLIINVSVSATTYLVAIIVLKVLPANEIARLKQFVLRSHLHSSMEA
jgi:O-antigen/teichoic acid export membrane protein